MADNHGNTPAAWTAVLIALVGFVVGGVGVALSPINYVLFWVGAGLVGVAAVAFLVMAKMGLHESAH
ncbi:HGxxPAAW family protein [Nocardioides sp. YIM 152588]|uniref:HGxxPAAW family protein n=1 Tax=Nocardioides sp. YIM 152588 TaxID=3158259 RepID=UPI0032E39B7C